MPVVCRTAVRYHVHAGARAKTRDDADTTTEGHFSMLHGGNTHNMDRQQPQSTPSMAIQFKSHTAVQYLRWSICSNRCHSSATSLLMATYLSLKFSAPDSLVPLRNPSSPRRALVLPRRAGLLSVLHQNGAEGDLEPPHID